MNERELMKFFGFGDDHVPLVKVAKSQKRQEIPVSFPTRKAPQKSIRARSTLMRDALIHFETNLDVVRISSYPIKLEYEATDWHGVVASVSHTPMLGIWTKPGAGFLCIEPWAGIADPAGFTDDFHEKPGVVTVGPGGMHRFGMRITITDTIER